MYQESISSQSIPPAWTDRPLVSDSDILDSLKTIVEGNLPTHIEPDLDEPNLSDIAVVEADLLQTVDHALDGMEDDGAVDQMASARSSGYSKTISDDAVGAFF